MQFLFGIVPGGLFGATPPATCGTVDVKQAKVSDCTPFSLVAASRQIGETLTLRLTKIA